MVQTIRCTRQYSLLLALALLVMQTYALYLNTGHVFHDMPPICQFCASVNNHEGASVGSATLFYIPNLVYFIDQNERLQAFYSGPSLYHSRAPPSFTIV